MKRRRLNSDLWWQRASGFTLTELLVVIGIIGVLAALLIPSVVATKRRANNIHCLGNLHQLGIAARTYADDNDGRLPNVSSEVIQPPDNVKRLSITDLLGDYVGKNREVLKCREDRNGWFELKGISYDWNQLFNGKLIDRQSGVPGSQTSSLANAMMYDHEPWHGHKNAAFKDGRVDRLR
jgi:prepilin-type N-terminal cleavage/methylation domain-containing protein